VRDAGVEFGPASVSPRCRRTARRRVTRLTPRQQRDMARAIKNAREMALLPYSARPGQ